MRGGGGAEPARRAAAAKVLDAIKADVMVLQGAVARARASLA